MKSSIRTAAMVAFGPGSRSLRAAAHVRAPIRRCPRCSMATAKRLHGRVPGGRPAHLADWSKRLAPDGTIDPIVEMLSQQNDILEDAVFMEGNLPTGHRYTQRTDSPAVHFRAINQGIPDSKSTTTQVDESRDDGSPWQRRQINCWP